jgi:hypothetical protein
MDFPAEKKVDILLEKQKFGVRVFRNGKPYSLSRNVRGCIIDQNGRTFIAENLRPPTSPANECYVVISFPSGDGDYTVSLVLPGYGSQQTTLAVFYGKIKNPIISNN